jgi:hypothetical protein
MPRIPSTADLNFYSDPQGGAGDSSRVIQLLQKVREAIQQTDDNKRERLEDEAISKWRDFQGMDAPELADAIYFLGKVGSSSAYNPTQQASIAKINSELERILNNNNTLVEGRTRLNDLTVAPDEPFINTHKNPNVNITGGAGSTTPSQAQPTDADWTDFYSKSAYTPLINDVLSKPGVDRSDTYANLTDQQRAGLMDVLWRLTEFYKDSNDLPHAQLVAAEYNALNNVKDAAGNYLFTQDVVRAHKDSLKNVNTIKGAPPQNLPPQPTGQSQGRTNPTPQQTSQQQTRDLFPPRNAQQWATKTKPQKIDEINRRVSQITHNNKQLDATEMDAALKAMNKGQAFKINVGNPMNQPQAPQGRPASQGQVSVTLNPPRQFKPSAKAARKAWSSGTPQEQLRWVKFKASQQGINLTDAEAQAAVTTLNAGNVWSQTQPVQGGAATAAAAGGTFTPINLGLGLTPSPLIATAFAKPAPKITVSLDPKNVKPGSQPTRSTAGKLAKPAPVPEMPKSPPPLGPVRSAIDENDLLNHIVVPEMINNRLNPYDPASANILAPINIADHPELARALALGTLEFGTSMEKLQVSDYDTLLKFSNLFQLTPKEIELIEKTRSDELAHQNTFVKATAERAEQNLTDIQEAMKAKEDQKLRDQQTRIKEERLYAQNLNSEYTDQINEAAKRLAKAEKEKNKLLEKIKLGKLGKIAPSKQKAANETKKKLDDYIEKLKDQKEKLETEQAAFMLASYEHDKNGNFKQDANQNNIFNPAGFEKHYLESKKQRLVNQVEIIRQQREERLDKQRTLTPAWNDAYGWKSRQEEAFRRVDAAWNTTEAEKAAAEKSKTDIDTTVTSLASQLTVAKQELASAKVTFKKGSPELTEKETAVSQLQTDLKKAQSEKKVTYKTAKKIKDKNEKRQKVLLPQWNRAQQEAAKAQEIFDKEQEKWGAIQAKIDADNKLIKEEEEKVTKYTAKLPAFRTGKEVIVPELEEIEKRTAILPPRPYKVIAAPPGAQKSRLAKLRHKTRSHHGKSEKQKTAQKGNTPKGSKAASPRAKNKAVVSSPPTQRKK